MIVLIRAMGAEGRLKKRRDAARRRGDRAEGRRKRHRWKGRMRGGGMREASRMSFEMVFRAMYTGKEAGSSGRLDYVKRERD